jgi:hypothetical protein
MNTVPFLDALISFLLIEDMLGSTESDCVHWSESCFVNEIMTPSINLGTNPLSRVTIDTLDDFLGVH